MKMRYYTHEPGFILEKTYFRLLELEIDILALKMTLNHQNNIRNKYFSQNYTQKVVLHLFYLYNFIN